MHLFFRDKKPNFGKVHEYVSDGFGIPHPERITGYDGTFMFTLPDVYVSDAVELLLAESPGRAAELWELLKRFKHNDYGEISKNDEYCNVESRYLGGGGSYMVACYRIEFGIVRFETLCDAAMLFIDGEDISSFRDEQEARRQKRIAEYAKRSKC